QTRDLWFFVPLAEPGITVDPASLSAPAAPGVASLPAMPPPIPGVFPNPNLPGVSHNVSSGRIVSAAAGLTRTFTITQTGPAAALPVIPPDKLPPATTMTVTPPNAAGEVTRTTTTNVSVSRTGGGTTGGGGTVTFSG